mmetsp:Transcript_57721/g.95781  ORF Transcript_57721/g.95781 Transcript_57721/m.95781 type:complete len:266 (+) Transcript_57721:31-828(+)
MSSFLLRFSGGISAVSLAGMSLFETVSTKKHDDEVILYASKYCPFSQRAWITLNLKRVPFVVKEIDLFNKSDEFVAAYKHSIGNAGHTNPEVPVLRTSDGQYISNSVSVLRYLDRKYENPSIFPPDAFQYIAVENFATWIAENVYPALVDVMLCNDKEGINAKMAAFQGIWDQMEVKMGDFEEGPFYAGKEIYFCDIILWPVFARLCLLEYYRAMDFDEWFARYPKLNQWYKAMKANKAVTESIATNDEMIEYYGKPIFSMQKII